MSPAPAARRAKGEPTALAKSDGKTPTPLTPHLFVPTPNAPLRDWGALFDLKQRPGYYNAAAKAALLRLAKKPPHDELLVDFSAPEVHIELKIAGDALLRGDWKWQTSIAGQSLDAQGPWSEVCWHREDAGDYLEIELPLADGWRLERLAFLAREDRFLLFADTLLGPGDTAVEIRHSHSLPILPPARFSPALETREGWLEAGSRRQATLVPPALSEWRSEFCHAELFNDGHALKLQQAALGRSLYAPLWIDLDPRRSKSPLTWRRLTVGESLAIVGRDVAAAYRVQVGSEQWLIYRSLTSTGNRSVLGLHTLSSFVCARILPSGETKEILAIE